MLCVMRIIWEIFIHFEGKKKFGILEQVVHIEATVIKIIPSITIKKTNKQKKKPSKCFGNLLLSQFWFTYIADNSTHLTLNIPSLARQRCLPSWGPRRIPWIFCNFSTVCCGRLLKLCFLGFWNYNSVVQALLASNILCLFISTEVTGGTELLITHPASEQCHLLSIVGGPFFKFTTFRT